MTKIGFSLTACAAFTSALIAGKRKFACGSTGSSVFVKNTCSRSSSFSGWPLSFRYCYSFRCAIV